MVAVEISDQEFATLLYEKANAGDPRFYFRVGLCYYDGTGIEQNYVEAAKWYKLAADQGYASAQYNLGRAFDMGEGVEKDSKEAVKWYKLAADQGFAVAQNNLGVCYDNGYGVLQDYNEAVRLFELSAAQGNWKAFDNLGIMHLYGRGVKRNPKKAKEYYEKALANLAYKSKPATDADKKRIQNNLDEVNALIAEEEQEQKEKEAAEARQKRIDNRKEVFISYSRKDRAYVDELTPHLAGLQRTAQIKWWDDAQLKPGDEWDKEIKAALARAKVAVMLVSADFFASDYIWRDELSPILEAAREEEATILWLLVRPCRYKGMGIDKYQAVADPKRPLAKCEARAERDEIYTTLVDQIWGILGDPPAE